MAETLKTVLVMGSTAIDQTGLYPGSFADYQDRYSINALNMAFQLSELRTSFGGCAPNIAYGLQMLGVNVIPLSSAGRNFRDRYQRHLESLGIRTDYIAVDDSLEHSATCLMINDQSGNQIIGFYPGPGSELRKLPHEVAEIEEVGLAVLGPEEPDLTLAQARDLASLGIPMVFDPGQVVASYQQPHIEELLGLCDYLIVNDHEAQVLETNSGLTREEIISLIGELVVTHGQRGVGVYKENQVTHVDAVPDVEIIEVTGCGDAFRAGYCYGILAGHDQASRARLGCIMAMRNLMSPETQRYKINLPEAKRLLAEIYG